MDAGMVQKVIDWVENNVGDRVSKQELAQKAHASSDLPQEGKDAIDEIPDGQYSKHDVMSMLQDKFMQKMGTSGESRMGGMGNLGL